MTLCQVLLTSSGVWACTDHRITRVFPNGRRDVATDATRKLVTVVNDDHRLLIVYTGLADARGGETGDWLRRVLRWGQKADVNAVVNRLGEYSEMHLAARAFQVTVPHAFIVAGFRHDGSRVCITMSNYEEQPPHTVRRHFAATSWDASRTMALMAPLAWHSHIPTKYRAVLQQLADSDAAPTNPAGVLKLLLTINYYMAHIKPMGDSISEHAVAVHVPSPTISSSYRPTVATTAQTLGIEPKRWLLQPEPPGLEHVQNAGLIEGGWDMQVLSEAFRETPPLPSHDTMSEGEITESFQNWTTSMMERAQEIWGEEP